MFRKQTARDMIFQYAYDSPRTDALNEIKIERIRYNYATYSSFWYVTSPSTQMFMNCVWGGVRGR